MIVFPRAIARWLPVRRVAPAPPALPEPPPPTLRAVRVRDGAYLPTAPPAPPPRVSPQEREMAATGGFWLDGEVSGVSRTPGALPVTVKINSGDLSSLLQSGGGQTLDFALPPELARYFPLDARVRVRLELDVE